MSDTDHVRFLLHDRRGIRFTYTNHQGEASVRRAIILDLFFGATEWQPERQAFVNALDLERGEHRFFAIKDMADVRYDDEF